MVTFGPFGKRAVFLDFLLANTPVIFIVHSLNPSVIPARREIRIFSLMNEFFNAGPSFNTESTPCWPVSRPVGVALAGYAFYASTSSGKEVSQGSSKGPSACVAENIWAPKKSKRQTTNQQMTNTRKDRWITQRTLRGKFLSQSSKWLP